MYLKKNEQENNCRFFDQNGTKTSFERMTAHEKLIIRSIQSSYYFSLSQHTYSIVCISYYTTYRYVAAIENKEARYI